MTKREPLPQEEREAALRDLMGPDPDAMVQAAKLLSSDGSTTPKLVELLKTEGRAETRQAILHALAWHPDLGVWDLMVSILADRNEAPAVRGQAAEGLAYRFWALETTSREFELGVNALLEALNDASPEVRYCALHALGTTGHPPLLPAMEKMLEDKTPVPGWLGTVSDEAARAIEFLGLKHRSRLRAEAEDEDE